MSSRLFSAAFLLLLLSTAGAAVPGPGPVFDWTAYPEVEDPGLINPAGYSFVKNLQMRFGYAVSDSAFEGFDRVSLVFPGGGLSGWWEDQENLRKFTISSGFLFFDGTASLGAAYTWFDPTVNGSIYSGQSLIDVGMIIRPVDWFSVGLVRRDGLDLDGVQDTEPSYRAGLAARPFGNRFTLTADLETGNDFDDYSFSAGAEYKPIEGLALRADAGEDMFRFGLELSFGMSDVAWGTRTSDDLDYQMSRGELILSSSPGENLLRPRGVFVRFDPQGMDEMRQRSFLGPVQSCFTENAMLLMRIARDNSVAGVIVDLTGPLASPAQGEELRSLLQSIRNSGKKVYFYIEDGSTASYYLASCADGIWLHPAGHVSFSGISSQVFFLRDFLDSVGIYPDFQHIGEYKSASDMLTRSDMSEAQREATTALLESFQEVLSQGVLDGRGFTSDQLREILQKGSFTAERALEAGMIDGICYQDQVEDEIGDGVTVMSLEEYASNLPSDDDWGPMEHVAVVTATGMIERGPSGFSFPFGRVMGSESICDALRLAASQPGVKAIVLRIDSGGGDALASADMHHTVSEIMDQGIPVIVSMGGVAASGGYYMACGAERIFADRLTITGSIGIISGKFAFGEMLDSLGVNVEEISTGPMAGMYSSFRRFSDPERQRAFELMHDGYVLFVETVADGRDMTFEQVDSIGRGRVWSGTDALGLDLVDQLGGVTDAVMYAAGSAGMDTRDIPEIRIYPTPPFPGSVGGPGFGVTEGLQQFLTEEQVLYLMQPLHVE